MQSKWNILNQNPNFNISIFYFNLTDRVADLWQVSTHFTETKPPPPPYHSRWVVTAQSTFHWGHCHCYIRVSELGQLRAKFTKVTATVNGWVVTAQGTFQCDSWGDISPRSLPLLHQSGWAGTAQGKFHQGHCHCYIRMGDLGQLKANFTNVSATAMSEWVSWDSSRYISLSPHHHHHVIVGELWQLSTHSLRSQSLLRQSG